MTKDALPIDVTQALKDAENLLRDFIAQVLERKFGGGWIDQCGVPSKTVEHWKQRKETEAQRQHRSGTVEERLLYYAEFHDLAPILKRHWDGGDFAAALGDWKTLEVWLAELHKLRDPDAHRRELLPHQKALAVGIAGEIRTRLVKFRSKLETAEDCFPRIDMVRDNLGNLYPHSHGASRSKVNLRVGDVVDFVVTASDPLEGQLSYGMTVMPNHHSPVWQEANTFQWRVERVGAPVGVYFWVKSERSEHAHEAYDDLRMTAYDVLPTRSR